MLTVEHRFSVDRSQTEAELLEEYLGLASDEEGCYLAQATEPLSSTSSDASVASGDDDDDESYFGRFTWPEDSDDQERYFYASDNLESYLNDHLDRKQINVVDTLGQRSKRSNKKLKARCQIKSKHAKSIKVNSHNQHLYMHHRLFRKVQLDPPSQNHVPSPPPAVLQPKVIPPYPVPTPNPQPVVVNVPPPPPSNQFRDYTIDTANIPNEPEFDDAMIAFLIDMQNRDL